MPKFYLHLCNGTGFTEDHEGSEHRDLDAVHAVAMATLREVLAGEIKEGGLNTASFVEIEDQHRVLVATVTFEEAVAVSDRVGDRPNCRTTSSALAG